jgi:hypothetical protein
MMTNNTMAGYVAPEFKIQKKRKPHPFIKNSLEQLENPLS